jgi:hypothetical protein
MFTFEDIADTFTNIYVDTGYSVKTDGGTSFKIVQLNIEDIDQERLNIVMENEICKHVRSAISKFHRIIVEVLMKSDCSFFKLDYNYFPNAKEEEKTTGYIQLGEVRDLRDVGKLFRLAMSRLFPEYVNCDEKNDFSIKVIDDYFSLEKNRKNEKFAFAMITRNPDDYPDLFSKRMYESWSFNFDSLKSGNSSRKHEMNCTKRVLNAPIVQILRASSIINNKRFMVVDDLTIDQDIITFCDTFRKNGKKSRVYVVDEDDSDSNL